MVIEVAREADLLEDLEEVAVADHLVPVACKREDLADLLEAVLEDLGDQRGHDLTAHLVLMDLDKSK